MSEQKRIEVSDEEMMTVLTVAIAEWVLGFERRKNIENPGVFEWRGPDIFGGGEPVVYTRAGALPPFATDPGLAVSLFTKIATDHDLIPELRIDNRMFASAINTPCHVKLTRRVEIKGGGGKVRYQLKPVVGVSSTTVPLAIAHAVVQLYEQDSALARDRGRLHRELFPARYMVVV